MDVLRYIEIIHRVIQAGVIQNCGAREWKTGIFLVVFMDQVVRCQNKAAEEEGYSQTSRLLQ